MAKPDGRPTHSRTAQVITDSSWLRWSAEGQTAEEAVADLREALDGWFAEFGVPDELTITVRDVA